MQTRISSEQTDAPLTINLRTLTLFEIFRQGWRLYWTNFSQILPIALVIYLPMNLLRYLFINLLGMTFYVYVGQVVEMGFTLFGFVAIVALIEGAIRGQSLSWHAALRYAWSRWHSVIGTMARLLLLFLGLILLWLIPGVLLVSFTSILLIWPLVFLLLIVLGKLFVDYGFSFYAVALRGSGGADAFAYSKALIHGQWWSICGCQFVITGAVLIPISFFSIICNSLFQSPLLMVYVITLSQLVGVLIIVMGVLLFLSTEQLHQDAGVSIESDADPLSTEEDEEIADAPLHTSFANTGAPRWFALTFIFGFSLFLLLLFVLMNM